MGANPLVRLEVIGGVDSATFAGILVFLGLGHGILSGDGTGKAALRVSFIPRPAWDVICPSAVAGKDIARLRSVGVMASSTCRILDSDE